MKPPVPDRDVRLLSDLEPTVASALDAHLEAADDWYPHQYVPFGQGRNFEGVYAGEPWHDGQRQLAPAVQAGLIHNLLSEDNLPSYHRVIADLFSRDGAWGTWVNRWTVEEGRHGMALRDYLIVTRATDPVALEDARSAHVQSGYDIDYRDDVLASLIYVTLQELATRVSYRNMRVMCGEPGCEALLRRISQDENRHMIFYRTVLDAASHIVPDRFLAALAHVIETFRVPGHSAPGYARMARVMAGAGIYSPTVHHQEVLRPLLRRLRVFDRTGLNTEGEQALERLSGLMRDSARRAHRFAHREAAEPGAARDRRMGVVPASGPRV
ncbi:MULTISPECIES: acyl-ACP desaturase [Streptomyces]|uniref:acyl-ACP desaturase n=1 Tax=Streptomyces TaxID=1883 RepID=UPI001E5E92C5|nr:MULTISPECIES: acyl-ACP desaturase [Streptomyces]UFQ19312.1 acyl-ACP desaturase [Streptomyces huasconensis]WCL88932.1 acyl-ACP desaturase [Streptomyces sp. JCM 35825]